MTIQVDPQIKVKMTNGTMIDASMRPGGDRSQRGDRGGQAQPRSMSWSQLVTSRISPGPQS